MLSSVVKNATTHTSNLSQDLLSYLKHRLSPTDLSIIDSQEFSGSEINGFLAEKLVSMVQQVQVALKQKYNIYGFNVKLQAGQGGKDAQNLTHMLYEMLLKFLARYSISHDILEMSSTDSGILNATISVKNTDLLVAFLLENGIIRIERISPFKPGQQVHTSHVKIITYPLVATSSIDIPPKEIEIIPIKAGGPGGQYVNKAYTGIIIKHKPTGIVIRSTQSRSAATNRKLGLELLKTKLLEKQLQSTLDFPAFWKNIFSSTPTLRTFDFTRNLMRNQHYIRYKLKNLSHILKGHLEPILVYNMIYVASQKPDEIV